MDRADRKTTSMWRRPRTTLSACLMGAMGALAVAVIPTDVARAQTTAGVQYTTSGSTVLPPKFAAAIVASGNASSETLTVDGRDQTVYTALLSWYRSELNDGGSFIVNKPSSYPRVNGSGDAEWSAFVPKLIGMSTVNGGWSVVTVRFVAPSGGTAMLVSSSDDSIRSGVQARLSTFKATMTSLSANTKAGTYFPGARVPTNLAAVRQAMLEYGNTERKTVGFRRAVGAKVATDIDARPASIKADDGLDEFVYSQQPDLQFDNKLNEAAQFFAEALATGNGAVHSGPSAWLDPSGRTVNMTTIGDRFTYFGAVGGAEIATGAGGSDAGAFPYAWMAGRHALSLVLGRGRSLYHDGLRCRSGCSRQMVLCRHSTQYRNALCSAACGGRRTMHSPS